jgi:anti-sigma B factor antagonist
MTVETVHYKRCDLVRPSGRFDSSTSPDLEQALRQVMDAHVHRIVLDMRNVTYFGSAAIRVLIMAYKECRRYRGDVRLTEVPERVHHVLELAGILPLITCYDDPVEAVGSF